MSMAAATDLLAFWEDSPPVFISAARIEAMVAAWLGVKRPGRAQGSRSAPPPLQGGDIRAVLQHPGMAQGKPVPLPEGNVFDFAALKARHAQE